MCRKLECILFDFVRRKVYLLAIRYVGALVSVIFAVIREMMSIFEVALFVRHLHDPQYGGVRRVDEVKANLKKSIADVDNIIKGLING